MVVQWKISAERYRSPNFEWRYKHSFRLLESFALVLAIGSMSTLSKMTLHLAISDKKI